MSVENRGFWSVLYEMTDLQQSNKRFNSVIKTLFHSFTPKVTAQSIVPESVEDDRALVKFIAGVEQLRSND